MAEIVGWTLIPSVRRFARRKQSALWLVLAGALLVLTALAPLLALARELPSAWDAATAIWAMPRTWQLLGNSVVLAGAVTAVALALGVPAGVLLGRTDIVGGRVAWLVHAFPMFLPPFILALGWFQWFGRNGLLGSDRTGMALFSVPGGVAILGLTFAPIATSLAALGVMSIEPSLEEAARTCARPVRVVSRILFPAAWPALALAAIVIFALTLSELGVPMFLRIDVFPLAVFARLGGVDYAPGEALALVLPVLPLALALLALERRFVGRRSYAVLGVRSHSRAPLPLGSWRRPLSVVCWLLALISVAPLLLLAARALRDHGVASAFEWARDAPINGLVASVVAASVVVIPAVFVGHAAARGQRSASWLEALALLAFLSPASVFGVGLIKLWNRPATQFIYATLAILVVAFVGRYAVLGVRVVATVVTQMPRQFEEAAGVCGAGYFRRMLGVVVPLGGRGIAFAWLLVLVFCLRDLETAILFYPPGREPLTVRIFTLEANGPEPIVAGLAVLHAVTTGAVLALGSLLFMRTRR